MATRELIAPLKPLFIALLLGAQYFTPAHAVTVPNDVQCYNPSVYGYDTYIVNNSGSAALQGDLIYQNNTSYWEVLKDGTFNTYPPASVAALQSGSYCFFENGDKEGGYVAYTIGSTDYAFYLELWGKADSGPYYMNVWNQSGTDWATSGNCPGTIAGVSPIAADNTSTDQTICNDDYIVNIQSPYVAANVTDNGIILTVMNNPAGAAGGSQTTGTTTTTANLVRPVSSAPTASAKASADAPYGIASRFVNGYRWSVVRNPKSGVLSGAVYGVDGQTLNSFVSCKPIKKGGVSVPFAYNCQQVGPRANPWKSKIAKVELSRYFFERPPKNDASPRYRAPQAGGDIDIQFALKNLAKAKNRKAAKTPDGHNVVSFNTGNVNWVLNDTGKRVFATVVHGKLGEPRFLDCSKTGASRKDVTMACREAYRCHFGPCTDNQWTQVSTPVTLPKNFFKPTRKKG